MSNPTAQAVTLTQDPSVAEDGMVIKPRPGMPLAKSYERQPVPPLLMGDFDMLGMWGMPFISCITLSRKQMFVSELGRTDQGGLACE